MLPYLVSTYFVLCFVTDTITKNHIKTMRSSGSVFTPNYRGGRQSCTPHFQRLTQWEGQHRRRALGCLSRGQCVSLHRLGLDQSCHTHPAKNHNHYVCVDSPFQLCSSTTYWQSREREKEKPIRSNKYIALETWAEVIFLFFPTSKQSNKAKTTLHYTVVQCLESTS